jgi:PEP-CTERM motif
MARNQASKVWLFAIGCGAGAAAGSGGACADAISLSATSTYSVDGGSSQMDSAASPPDLTDPNISPSASGVDGSTVFGHDYSTQPTGSYQFGSRSSGMSTYSITGSANYTDTFTVGASGAYAFQFDLDAGEMSVSIPTGVDGQQSSSLQVVITETIGSGAPVTLFDYNASMSVLSSGVLPTFTETGATLNSAGPTKSAGSGDYVWNVYQGSVSIGSLAQGEVVTISETITSSATGTSDPQSCSGGGGNAVFEAVTSAITDGGGGACGSALARIGDPPTLDALAPSVVPAGSPVPEPATWGLLGLGFASLALIRRRRMA